MKISIGYLSFICRPVEDQEKKRKKQSHNTTKNTLPYCLLFIRIDCFDVN